MILTVEHRAQVNSKCRSKLVYHQRNVSWVSFVLNTFTSRSEWRFAPFHIPVQYPDLCDVSKCCAWSQCGKMLDVEIDAWTLFLELLLLCSRARHRKVVTPSVPRHVSCARMIQTRRKLARVRSHGFLTCNIEALCCVLRYIHGLVQNCVPTLAVVAFTCGTSITLVRRAGL